VTENIEHRLGRAILLRLESGRPLTILSPAWAGLCGLLVSGGLAWNLHTLVIVVLLLLLVEPLMGGLWEQAITAYRPTASPVSVAEIHEMSAIAEPAVDDPPGQTDTLLALPFARAGSPGDRLLRALAVIVTELQAQRWERTAFLLNLLFALAVASVLGSATLLLAAVILLAARLHWPTGLPALMAEAGYAMLLPWLMGMAALGHVAGRDLTAYRPALLLMLTCTIAYVACLMLARGAGRPALAILDATQVAVLLYLLIRHETPAVWLVGMCLVGQWAMHADFLHGGSGPDYLRRAAVYIALGMIAAALALAPALTGV